MSRKTKHQPSPGQLSLEDLPEFWSKGTNQESRASLLLPEKSPGCTKEAANKYQIIPKTVKSLVNTFDVPQLDQIPVYVGLTFDPCQGIREVKQKWKRNRVPSEVVFDCRPLELAPKYATEPKLDELFAPEEKYLLLGRGGLLSSAVFINILRCYGTLAKWSQDVHKETGTKSISQFKFIQPDPDNRVGKLWDVLGMSELTKKKPQNAWTSSGELEFQSRIVMPLLMVNSSNRNDVLTDVQDWLNYISKRLGSTQYRLFKVICEVVKNLVEHGERGTFGVSIWPSGQIEILWSNPIDHLIDWWPPEDTAHGLANSLLSLKGAGMRYIYEDLLPTYKGVLIVNWKTHNLIFRSAGDFSIMGLHPRSDSFLPRSILFHLHLFCPETRNRSSSNARH